MGDGQSFNKLAALVVSVLLLGLWAGEAGAQTAKKLKCAGCVKSKQLKNNSIKGKDIKDGSIGEADLGFSPATAGDIGLLMTKIDNLAHLQASGASAYVFVTSETYNGNLGGVAGADEKCQTLADAAGLPGIYLAWIADSNAASAPATRFTQAPSAYILPPGDDPNALATVAQSFAALNTLEVPINVTEEGGGASGTVRVWTCVEEGSGSGGCSTPRNVCLDWTSSTSDIVIARAIYGDRTRVDFGAWSSIAFSNCNLDAHLYCFGQ